MADLDAIIEIDLHAELMRADAKFGAQLNLPDVYPDTDFGGDTGLEVLAEVHGIRPAASAKAVTDNRAGRDLVSWADILVEEVAEAVDAAAFDPSNLRAELVQVAAVAVRWVQALDDRGAHHG